MSKLEKCGAQNPSTCRYHGIASIYAPINDAKAAQAILEKAGYAALSASGKAEFTKAEKARETAHRQLLSVPSVRQVNQAAGEKLWTANSLDVKDAYRAYLRWNTGTIEREKTEALHRAVIFSTKSLYGELTVNDLKQLAARTPTVRVEGSKLFLDGSNKPLLGVENGKVVAYSEGGEKAEVAYGDDTVNLAKKVTSRRVAQVEARQEKRMLSHTRKLAKHLGGRLETSVDPYSPKETLHTIYTGAGDAIAQYRTTNGVFSRGTIAIDGRQGTSRDAKLWDIEYRMIEASQSANLGNYTLPSYMTEEQPAYQSYDEFGRTIHSVR